VSDPHNAKLVGQIFVAGSLLKGGAVKIKGDKDGAKLHKPQTIRGGKTIQGMCNTNKKKKSELV